MYKAKMQIKEREHHARKKKKDGTNVFIAIPVYNPGFVYRDLGAGNQ